MEDTALASREIKIPRDNSTRAEAIRTIVGRLRLSKSVQKRRPMRKKARYRYEWRIDTRKNSSVTVRERARQHTLGSLKSRVSGYNKKKRGRKRRKIKRSTRFSGEF